MSWPNCDCNHDTCLYALCIHPHNSPSSHKFGQPYSAHASCHVLMENSIGDNIWVYCLGITHILCILLYSKLYKYVKISISNRDCSIFALYVSVMLHPVCFDGNFCQQICPVIIVMLCLMFCFYIRLLDEYISFICVIISCVSSTCLT